MCSSCVVEPRGEIRAGVALGSNVGDRLVHLKNARQKIRELSRFRAPLVSSAIYETEPVGCEPGANNFLNAVIEVGYDGRAIELLRELRNIELALGRPADHPRSRSRTVDLDLLYFADQQIDTPDLQLPHPRISERRFVLAPLADVRPDLILPRHADSIAALLARLPELPAVVRFASEW
jgi:2-amino-4-hydroxy-6-hydroxymethyldihydropteridine diphosphokinase